MLAHPGAYIRTRHKVAVMLDPRPQTCKQASPARFARQLLAVTVCLDSMGTDTPRGVVTRFPTGLLPWI